MGRAEVLQEVRKMRFEEILSGHKAGRLSGFEAAQVLGCSERTFRRRRARFEAEGYDGLLDRRIGKVSPHRIAADEVERIVSLYRNRYQGWTVKHFHERAQEKHGLTASYGWTKSVLHASGLVRPAAKRSAHRKKRPRKPLPGMMLHQDGSRHRWVPALDRQFDLVVTLDDATSEVYSAFLVEEEGTASTFRALGEVIGRHGLFCSLYTDRGSHYFTTPAAGGKVAKEPTQVGRALAQLGITHIASYSAQGRGRMERVFGTLQGRLPHELRLARITTIAAANRFLAERFVLDYNARFAVPAAEEGTAFLPYAGRPLEDVLCVQEDRQVGRDNCVRWDGRALQIPAQRHRHHYVKATVRVHEYPNGRLAIFDGPRCLARFDRDGTSIDASRAA